MTMMRAAEALSKHWPEYLIEGWALGTFMISAGLVATVLEYPHSALHETLTLPAVRHVIAGLLMGGTAVVLIYSPWGKRSGDHMNPAVTLTYYLLGRVRGWDALFFVIAQTLGGTIGIIALAAVVGSPFRGAPVNYAATMPGSAGPLAAFLAEWLISAILMGVILIFSGNAKLAPRTGIAAGVLIASYVSLESPLSGMSMNPARSFASAAPGSNWEHFWIYLIAPPLGMLTAGRIFVMRMGHSRVACAMLSHSDSVPCIHCGYKP
jgi:aquaporin Z